MWKIEIFLDVLKESVPSLNWSQVIFELDHPGFMIKDVKGLQLIVFSFLKSAQSTPFPIQHIYRKWKNALGQVL